MNHKHKEFTIALYRPGYTYSGDQSPPELNLPAEPAELLDLLDKARIDDPLQAYWIDITFAHRDYLYPLLADQPLNVFELNYFAGQLAGMGEHDGDALEGLLRMEQDIPNLARLINLTHTVGDAAIAYGVRNDIELGKWSYENGFIQKLNDLPDGYEEYLDFERIGKQRREDEHGVFTREGYIANLNWPEISAAYNPAHPPWLQQQPVGAGLVVDFYRYDFVTGEAGSESISAELPVSEETHQKILQSLGCDNNELSCIPRFCLIPSMLENICPDENVETLNAFAVCVDGLHAQGKLPLYKAVLEATHCDSIYEAAGIGAHIQEYQLDTSLMAPGDYAQKELEKRLGYDEASRLAKYENLTFYGRDLMEKNHVVATSYGYLSRVDSGQIIAAGETPRQAGPVQEQTM